MRSSVVVCAFVVLKSVCLFNFHSENVGSVYSLGNLIAEYSALVNSFCHLNIISQITIATPAIIS